MPRSKKEPGGERRRVGRPPLGNTAADLRRLPVYGTPEDLALLAALAAHWGCSKAAGARRAIREAAAREGVTLSPGKPQPAKVRIVVGKQPS
jgi:hypothetical protein